MLENFVQNIASLYNINTLYDNNPDVLLIKLNVRTFPKSNRNIVQRAKIDTPNTQIHDLSHFWLGTDTSIKKKVTGLNYLVTI